MCDVENKMQKQEKLAMYFSKTQLGLFLKWSTKFREFQCYKIEKKSMSID